MHAEPDLEHSVRNARPTLSPHVSPVRSFARILFLLLVFLSPLRFARADASDATPIGYWKTIDDKTGKARSIVKIFEYKGELRGRIEKLLVPPKDDPNPICKKCPGDKKNRPVRGLEFMWGFKRDGQKWSDGHLMDPEDGNIYHGDMEVLDGGKRLKLYGYVRVVVKIGRSQIWTRVAPGDYGLK
jgi:uncharacterized protein (DUF2147 family)